MSILLVKKRVGNESINNKVALCIVVFVSIINIFMAISFTTRWYSGTSSVNAGVFTTIAVTSTTSREKKGISSSVNSDIFASCSTCEREVQNQQLDQSDFASTFTTLDQIDAVISSKIETLLGRRYINNDDIKRKGPRHPGPLKFYMYQHPNLTLSDPSYWPLGYRNRAAFKLCTDEIYFDESMFVVLERSSRRTLDPEEADVFIIPIPMGRVFSAKNSTAFWDLSFSTLVQEKIFLQHFGHRHILIATGFPLFKNRILPLVRHYPKISNVTLVQSWDPNGVAKAIQGARYDKFHEYEPYFKSFTPITRSSMSLGLGTKPDSTAVVIPEHLKYPAVVNIPLKIPSMDHWRNASNFIFYHTRTTPSLWNSTIYRHVPVTNVTMSHLPPSSIGWDVTVKQWLREYVDSKFCLTIRGDSPHSKAFTRSIRAGCIPVVIADCLPVYAPVFKSILNMSDYAIILEEKKFVEDPERELLKLLDLTEEEIQGKIQHLAFAQRVMMMDHPESLFVEAFLYEAVQAFKS